MLRVVDDQVAAELELAEAHRRQAAADALRRRSMESAAVGMCTASPEGPLLEVNQAFCEFFGYDTETMLTKTWIDLTAPEFLEADLAKVADMVAGRIESYEMDKAFIHADGHRIWGHLAVGCVRNPDGSVAMSIGQIVDITDEVRTQEQLAASEERYRLLTQNASDAITHIRDGKFAWVSAAIEQVLGAPPEHWIGRAISEIVPPDGIAAQRERLAILDAGGTIRGRFQVVAVDGVRHWVDLHASPYFDAEGRRDGFTGSLRLVDDLVAAEAELASARRQKARADQLYRRSVDNAAVGMCLIDPTGGFVEVNEAVCEFFGYDADTLKQKTWQDLTAPAFLEADLARVDDILQGRRDSYRMLKQYVHADGHLIWGDLSVTCVRDAAGQVERFISQILDVTETVETNAANVRLNQQMTAELHSAAKYVASILPTGLTGPVVASSRYIPARDVGGDCFDYRWIDEDHLMVYVFDVSGHGIESALLAVSVHNLLRSGALPDETRLAPDHVLAELNDRFRMEDNNGHFLTMWYGIYQKSTRTMTYASAGHPPALAIVDGRATQLATETPPVGMFSDTRFTTAAHPVAPDSQLLLYSDGAFEISLPNGDYLTWEEFADLATALAATPYFSLDTLKEELRRLTPTGIFTDDCSLVALRFDGQDQSAAPLDPAVAH